MLVCPRLTAFPKGQDPEGLRATAGLQCLSVDNGVTPK